jgi:PilZ domain
LIYVTRAEREHARYAHDVAVTFRVGAKAFEGRTRNVSRGGLCATISDAVPNGTDIDVEIVLVFDDGMQSEALRLPGRVAWCTTVDEANQVGISFRGLDKQRSQYLTMFLRYLDDQRTEQPAGEQSLDDRFR